MVRNRFHTLPTLSDPGHLQVCQGVGFIPSHSARGFLVARLAGISPPLSLVARFPSRSSLSVTRRSPRSSLVAHRSASSLHLHRAPRRSELALLVAPLLPLSLLVTRLDCRSSLRRSPRSLRWPLVACLAYRLPPASLASFVDRRSSLVARRSLLVTGLDRFRPPLTLALRRTAALQMKPYHFAYRTLRISTNRRYHTVSSEIRHSKRRCAADAQSLLCAVASSAASSASYPPPPPRNFEWRISDNMGLPVFLSIIWFGL